MSSLPYTGERIIPGAIPVPLFNEHEDRYRFAAAYVKNKSVVDVACGVGIGSQFLLDAGATRVTGIDIDPVALEYARAEYKDCNFVACDAQRLLLADNSADVIVSFETIEHIPDPLGFLRECRRVLKPEGLFICSTPNHAVCRWWGLNPFHNREFFPQEFTDLVASLFGELETYSQRTVFYPKFVVKRVISYVLEKISLKHSLDRFLGRTPPAISPQRRFSLNGRSITREIEPYAKGWLVKPTYLLVIGRKPNRHSES